jgi:hypothetical protein
VTCAALTRRGPNAQVGSLEPIMESGTQQNWWQKSADIYEVPVVYLVR